MSTSPSDEGAPLLKIKGKAVRSEEVERLRPIVKELEKNLRATRGAA